MRDDLSALLAPPRLPNGAPNPAHLAKATYLERARDAAVSASRGNEVDPSRVRISFPDRSSFAPVRAKATVVGKLDLGSDDPQEVEAAPKPKPRRRSPAAARVPRWRAAAATAARSSIATEGMRPDVAAAYDQMAAAAAAAGITLIVVSGFRSDAEQADSSPLIPIPNGWRRRGPHCIGAPPSWTWAGIGVRLVGRERGPLRLPPQVFVGGRHFGSSPARRRARRREFGAGGPGQAGASSGSLPSFVRRASATPWSTRGEVERLRRPARRPVDAESGFNPFAVSPAGAEGIAQFMPGTASSYGLADPFDPVEAIDAQAHLMSDLIHQFGSPELALAAYNAGPAPVEACSCVPAISETSAYVARIMALVGASGALAVPTFEVRSSHEDP